jgi:hypothetical protein
MIVCGGLEMIMKEAVTDWIIRADHNDKHSFSLKGPRPECITVIQDS